MILNISKILTCRCPVCNERFFTEITPFKINSENEFLCDVCEAELFRLSKIKTGYRIKIPCFLCEDVHSYTLSFDGMWKKPLSTLGCGASGIDIMYIGDRAEVYPAALENDELLTEITNSLPEDLYDDIDPLLKSAIEVINRFVANDLISCDCGDCEVIIKLCKSGFTISCGNCGKSLFVPLESEENLNALKRLYFIKL